MRIEQTCRAIVQAAARLRPRYVHLAFWGLWVPVVALSAANPQSGRVVFASAAMAYMVAQVALPVAGAFAFRRYLTRAELWVAWMPALAMIGIVLVNIFIVMIAMVTDVPEALLQAASAGLTGLALVVALGVWAACVVAGRALRRLRWAAGDAQVTDFAIWVMFYMYFAAGAAMLNPMLRRALATEKA